MAKKAPVKIDDELFAAIARNDATRVLELLAQGANANATDAHGQTPVMRAAETGYAEIFAPLAKAGADLKAKSGNATIFWKAGICKHGDEAASLAMLKIIVPAVDLTEYGESLNYMLALSSEDRSAEYLRELIHLGADANHVDEEGEGPLLYAVWFNRPAAVKELLAAGADANTLVPKKIGEWSTFENIPRKFRGQPLIELALGKRFTEIANILKSAGARSNASAEAAPVAHSNALDVSWQRIEDWIKGNARGWKPLKKGASETLIAKAEAKLGLTFPEDLRQFLQRHNGSDDLIPAADCHYFLMPLSEIVADAKMMAELLDGGEFDAAKAKPDKGIQKAWWHKGWLPFAADGGGNHYCVDLEPAKGGNIGQIISFNHEAGERALLSPSLLYWLFDFANELDEGKLSYDEDEGLVG